MAALENAIANNNQVKVTASLLNVRTGPGTNNKVVGTLRKNTICNILEIQNGWGKINNPSGWICLDYTSK